MRLRTESPKRKLDAPILCRRVLARPRCVRNAIIEFRTLQTDAVSRTRHLQRADCHADRLGDLLTAHSALDQIPDLLEAFCARRRASTGAFRSRSSQPHHVHLPIHPIRQLHTATGARAYRNMTILELVNLQVLILGGSMDSDYAALAELPPSKIFFTPRR
jgi:hypothetical protein